MNNKEQIKEFFKKNNFVPSKKMGQNFLFNEKIQQKIIDLTSINSNNDVIEIGPGLGALTKKIIKKANKVIAIELDKRLYNYLKTNINNKNLILINDNVLNINFNNLIKKYNLKNVKLVSNLPYAISSKIILNLIKDKSIDEIYVMVQKEMANRFKAKKNTKEYNALSVLVQCFCDIDYLLEIKSNHFIPEPKIDSIFLKIFFHHKYDIEYEKINQFLKKCFNNKRKTLINNLLAYYDKNEIYKALEKLNINNNIRAEDLNISEFIKLNKIIDKIN